MRKIFIGLVLLILVITACTPEAQPTEIGTEVEEQPTQVGEELTPLQQEVISKVASNLGITEDQVRLVSSEAVEWPDSCLGIETEGIACAEVITAGQRIVLDVAGKQVEYHTNEDGSVVLPATLALNWSRSGGVAGFCDQLRIYLSGEVQFTNCKNSEIMEKPLSDLLSQGQIATLDDWISKYGNVSIDASDPQGVADGMSVQLEMFGLGSQQITSPEVEQALMLFVQDLSNKFMNP